MCLHFQVIEGVGTSGNRVNSDCESYELCGNVFSTSNTFTLNENFLCRFQLH